MPFIRSLASEHCAYTVAVILLLGEIMPLYSKIYYKEENYLKVKTAVFKYITPPIVKVEYVGMLVY